MRPIAIAALASLTLAAACSTQPSFTREKTMMTPSQIADMGLTCRKITPIGTTIPRNMCASEAAWDNYDEQGVLSSEELFRETRTIPNAGRFNRD